MGVFASGRLAVNPDFVRRLNDADLQFVPDLLDGRKLYLSVGHDEYWSWGMRDAVEGIIANGGNAAFSIASITW